MTRRRFSERDVLATLIHQGVDIRCYRTGIKIDLVNVRLMEREHLHEVELGGPDIPANCRYSLNHAHKIVTNGTKATSAGSSKQRIAKTRRSPEKFRIAPRECGQKRVKSGKIKSRGFRK